jgi:hypothetical protein
MLTDMLVAGAKLSLGKIGLWFGTQEKKFFKKKM